MLARGNGVAVPAAGAAMTGAEPEEILTGGNVSGAVVRAGATVRKRAAPATPAVEALLRYLNAAEFPAAPRTLGRDERRRRAGFLDHGSITHIRV
jgi:hypothetical protein